MATRRQAGAGVAEELTNQPPAVRATLEKASREGGAAVGEGIGAMKNSGGGELRIKASDATGLGILKNMLPSNFLTDEKGNLALINPENEIKFFNSDGKEIKVGNTITVMVTENGIGIKNMDSMGRLMPPKTKAEISPELALAINNEFNRSGQGVLGGGGKTFTVPAGTLPDFGSMGSGIASDFFNIKGTGRTKEEKEAKTARQKARDLGIEGIAND
jgi:hypothetical protein